MKISQDLEVKLIDFKTHKTELIQLRQLCWEASTSNINFKKFFTEKDELVDLSSMHCAVFKDKKLIASHRLTPIDTIEDLPFIKHFKASKIIDSNWYTFSEDEVNYVVMKPPIVTTGRLVIHPNFRKKGIAEKILTFWFDFLKNENIKTLISFPSPWMVNKLLEVGFEFEKQLGDVTETGPTINITLVIKKF
ncbi:MAG: GNAT superfamily N-acetyltransferase [Polaribacter sp.]|jgi:GNAT superfamily N-acetyltransferase